MSFWHCLTSCCNIAGGSKHWLPWQEVPRLDDDIIGHFQLLATQCCLHSSARTMHNISWTLALTVRIVAFPWMGTMGANSAIGLLPCELHVQIVTPQLQDPATMPKTSTNHTNANNDWSVFTVATFLALLCWCQWMKLLLGRLSWTLESSCTRCCNRWHQQWACKLFHSNVS